MGSKEGKEKANEESRKLKDILTFQQWCELNGRRWQGAFNYEEFEKNADDYQRYRGTYEEKEDGR